MKLRRVLATAGAGAVGVALAASVLPASAFAALTAPKGFTVTRAADDVNKIQISWKPVLGAEYYNLDIIQGETQTVTKVPADITSYTFTAPDTCVSYKMRVGTGDTAGSETYTGYTFAKSLAPGAVMGMKTGREEDGTVGTAAWREPAWLGYKPLNAYHVQMTRLIDGVVLLDEMSTQTSYRFPNLDPSRAYVLKVATYNEYGTCLTAKSLFDRYRPSDPTSLTATRRADDPATVDVAWQPAPETPAPTYYQLTYSAGATKKTVLVNAPLTAAGLSLDPAQDWVIQVKSYNENGGSGAVTTSLSANATPVTPTATAPAPAAVDATPPTITAALSGRTGRNNWYTGPVTVTFTCTDTQSKVANCPTPVTLTEDGAAQVVNGTTADGAGNVASTSVRVSIDQTAPTITGTVVGHRNGAGWYRSAPTIRYSCDDAVSTVINCPGDVDVTRNGANQGYSAVATDDAGNTADSLVTGLNVDLAAPTVTPLGASNGSVFELGKAPALSCDTTDEVSGVVRQAALAVRRDERGGYTATCAGGTDAADNAAGAATLRYTVKPTVASLVALTLEYLGPEAKNGARQDLTGKLYHGQFPLYITKVLKEATGGKATLTADEAAELTYWARVLIEQS